MALKQRYTNIYTNKHKYELYAYFGERAVFNLSAWPDVL